jgi:hypothetical protein
MSGSSPEGDAMKESARLLRSPAVLLLIGLLSCGGDLTLPGTSAAGLNVTVVKGDKQQGAVGQALPDPVVVVVKTDAGELMADRRVDFVAQSAGVGGFDPATAVTDSVGEASTRWVLGTAPGVYLAEARVIAPDTSVQPAVTFQAAAVAGAPDTLRAVGPTSQPGRRGQPLAEPLVVMTVDEFGNPVPGAQVEWTSDEGELSADTTDTGADGTASVTWTLGDKVGFQKAAATVEGATGSPVTFTSVVLF